MTRNQPFVIVLARLLIVACLGGAVLGGAAFAQRRGGILKMESPDSPGGLSIQEESTVFSMGPMMGVHNNLILFNQHEKQNRLEAIVPDLATSWTWSADGTTLTFPLRQGVRFHDGRPFTARDVLCTFDLILEKSKDRLRVNPRKASFENVADITANGDFEVTFHLKRPQPAFPMLLAGVGGAIYPCHVPAAEMRKHPIGTGPFIFEEFRPNEVIRVRRNPDYWKPDRPYLDGIEYQIIRNVSTATLAFVSGKVDMTFPYDLTMPLLKDVRSQVADAMCEITPGGGINRHLIVNRTVPPFDNPDLRRAMALTIDRQAFIDLLSEGQGEVGGVLQPRPGGLWGAPPDLIRTLPGYGTDIVKNRREAREIMERLGYGPNRRLALKLMSRDLSAYKNAAVILIDQLREIYIDAEMDVVEVAQYFPRVFRRDFTIGLNLQTSGPDPDPVLRLFYGCGSTLNWDGYCDAGVDQMIEAQSRESDHERRAEIRWKIEKKLAEDVVRPIIFYSNAATCWRPYVKGLTLMVNSIFSGNRREDIWLDK